MEIDDGGAAAAEFTSDEDLDYEHDPDQSESESDDSDQTKQLNEQSGNESGEIVSHSENEEQLTSEDTGKISPKALKKKKKRSKRDSVEECLNTMSSTLLVVKDLLLQTGIAEIPDIGSGKSKE